MMNWCKFFVSFILVQSDVSTCFSSSNKNKIDRVVQFNQLKPKENIFYYAIGDTVRFTCENLRSEKYAISLTENLGNFTITTPTKYGHNFSISVTLGTYDNGSTWNCSIFEEGNLNSHIVGINFVTLESTVKRNYGHSFINNNLRIVAQFLPQSEHPNEIYCEDNEIQCYCYILEDGRIVSTATNKSNLCIQFADDPNDSHHIKRFTSKVLKQNNIEATITTTYTPVTIAGPEESKKDSDFNDDDDAYDDSENEKFLIIGAAVLILIIVISIITIFVCRKRKKNKATTEVLYATANEVSYVELQLQNASSASVPRNDVPYAQVIGFLNKMKKK